MIEIYDFCNEPVGRSATFDVVDHDQQVFFIINTKLIIHNCKFQKKTVYSIKPIMYRTGKIA